MWVTILQRQDFQADIKTAKDSHKQIFGLLNGQCSLELLHIQESIYETAIAFPEGALGWHKIEQTSYRIKCISHLALTFAENV